MVETQTRWLDHRRSRAHVLSARWPFFSPEGMYRSKSARTTRPQARSRQRLTALTFRSRPRLGCIRLLGRRRPLRLQRRCYRSRSRRHCAVAIVLACAEASVLLCMQWIPRCRVGGTWSCDVLSVQPRIVTFSAVMRAVALLVQRTGSSIGSVTALTVCCLKTPWANP